ncbi:M23 family metallopeptidase [Microbacterium sp. SSM24]|uniref:M23 family metallopeptidase n=1 Tax=Microbacterium sp. SSM24 TaxID=2991714 RepID=UPI002227401B|nr:M23 family metallopeptidase [Microbacterium sp. SSM24]MCW3491957.1 M23 family metallopeptidase [Microbacterium sp. SSM24]
MTTSTAVTTRPATRAPKRAAKQVRSLFALTLVGGLVAAAAMPAFAGVLQKDEAMTLQQMAVDDAQSVVVASDAVGAELTRESYSATTSDEIAKKKAAEAAAERARLSAQTATTTSYNIDLNMVAPGSGAVRWPLTSYTLTDTYGTRGGAHRGIDLVAPAGTPIYAAAAGVVKVSSEAYYDYGVAITIDHVINGQVVNTLYAHQSYGCRKVVAGQTVQVGQVIGCVGSTGRSTANHLHFEVYMNGGNVDPLAWLNANAG